MGEPSKVAEKDLRRVLASSRFREAESINEKVRVLRKDYGQSYGSIAKLLHLSKSRVQRIVMSGYGQHERRGRPRLLSEAQNNELLGEVVAAYNNGDSMTTDDIAATV